MEKKVLVIGAGLAGCEAAWFLARHGINVVLVENKVLNPNPAQKMPTYAELVCTNSLKSKNENSAHGLLKKEMKGFGSLVLEVGEKTAVPAGDALAVDREKFSTLITEKIKGHSRINTIDEECSDPLMLKEKYGCDFVIVATGPLTTDALSSWIQKNLSEGDFYFYDAIAPVVDADTLDLSKMYYKDRHKEVDESADYLNAPMTQEQYYAFIDELVGAQKVPPKDFEEYRFFEACLPIDLMAQRGKDTPRFSCMKPIGLETSSGDEPFAVVQLRKENLLGSAFNLVGFQTRLTYKEQLRVFRMIPGFEEASFIHLGSVHRNSFLNAKELLNIDLSTKKFPELFFAGQITGVEGYTESSSMGLYVALQILRRYHNLDALVFPVETAMGALVNYLKTVPKPTPSSINFGLIPSVVLTREQRKMRDKKKLKKELASQRAQEVFQAFIKDMDYLNQELSC